MVTESIGQQKAGIQNRDASLAWNAVIIKPADNSRRLIENISSPCLVDCIRIGEVAIQFDSKNQLARQTATARTGRLIPLRLTEFSPIEFTIPASAAGEHHFGTLFPKKVLDSRTTGVHLTG